MIENIISVSASGFEVRETCAALGVSASGFYAHRHKAERLRHREDRVLADELRSAFDDSDLSLKAWTRDAKGFA